VVILVSEHVARPLVHETYNGTLSFPSGNVRAVCATAVAIWLAYGGAATWPGGGARRECLSETPPHTTRPPRRPGAISGHQPFRASVIS
jgi:hypothetical protein